MQTNQPSLVCRDAHIAAWKAIWIRFQKSSLTKIQVDQDIVDFVIALGKTHLDISSVTEPTVEHYPHIANWASISSLFSYSNATELVFDMIDFKFRVYSCGVLIMTTGRVAFNGIVNRLKTDPLCQIQYTFDLMEHTFMSAQAVFAKLGTQLAETADSIELIPSFLEALESHRRIWSSLALHCTMPKDPESTPVSIPKRHVEFMAEVGRVLASYPDTQNVCYPDGMMMIELYHFNTPEFDIDLAYSKEDKRMIITLSEGDQPPTTSHCVFTFESVLGMLDSFKEKASKETQDVIIKTYAAARACLAGKPITLPAPMSLLGNPENVKRVAELTLELWQHWKVDLNKAVSALGPAIESCIPAIEAAAPVIEQDPVTAMIARQRLMLERIALWVVSSDEPIVKLPDAYAKFLLVYAGLYESLPEGDWAIFEELHAGYFKVIAPADDWKAWYNKSCSVLTLTSLADAIHKNAVPKVVHWSEDSRKKYCFVSFEPMLTKRQRSLPFWSVKVSAHSPWDFGIEMMLLDRLERRLKDADQVDELTLKTLEALDPVVQNCLEEIRKGL